MQGLLTMVKLKSLITERVDFYEIATQLVKKAGLKSKVKFINTGDNKADYNVDDDVIRIKPTSRFKDFLVTVFHEIDHAKDAQRLGKKRYKKEYEMEMNKAAQAGKDPHDDNFYEKKADWIQSQIEKGYDDILFLDDSPKNVTAVKKLKQKYPKIKMDARVVNYG